MKIHQVAVKNASAAAFLFLSLFFRNIQQAFAFVCRIESEFLIFTWFVFSGSLSQVTLNCFQMFTLERALDRIKALCPLSITGPGIAIEHIWVHYSGDSNYVLSICSRVQFDDVGLCCRLLFCNVRVLRTMYLGHLNQVQNAISGLLITSICNIRVKMQMSSPVTRHIKTSLCENTNVHSIILTTRCYFVMHPSVKYIFMC